MPEQEPSPTPEFDTEAIAKALRTRAATVRDVAYGEGHLFSAGQGAVRLEIYPRTKVTRVTTQDARIELFGTTGASASGSGIDFARVHAREEASLTVLSDAGVVFTFIAGGESTTDTSPEPAQAPQTAVIESPAPSDLPDPEPPVVADVAAPHDPSSAHQPDASGTETASPPLPPDTDPTATATEARERGELVKFVGRLGKDPFVSGKAGRPPHVRLSVGEHYEDEDGQDKTRWHEVWAASSNADAVKRMAEEGQLHKGVEVRVRGYRHERGPDNQGRPQRPFVRAFRIDLAQKQPKRRGNQG